MTRSAAIVGGGIGGLSTAIALTRAGMKVDLFERSDTFAEVGAGLQMSPNAMKALAWLGVADKVQAAGFAPRAAAMRHFRTGKAYLNAPLGATCQARYGAPYIHIHRADLHAILVRAAAAAGVSLTLGAAASGYAAGQGGPRLSFVGGDEICADLIVGADGVRSVIRDGMLGAEQPRFTGQVAWRGVVPTSALPPGLIPPDATVWVGPGRHFVAYYLRGGDLVNFVAVEERADWTDESWTQPGDPAALRAAFRGWDAPVGALLDAVEDAYLWALFDRAPLPRWTDGAAVLIGDACHPTLPFMAQGAAMAIEDAVVLARAIGDGDGDGDLSIRLARYEAARKPRATDLQARARANARLFHMAGPLARAKLAAATLLPDRAALRPLDPVYGYDPTR